MKSFQLSIFNFVTEVLLCKYLLMQIMSVQALSCWRIDFIVNTTDLSEQVMRITKFAFNICGNPWRKGVKYIWVLTKDGILLEMRPSMMNQN